MIVLTELTVLGFGVRRRESWYLADLVCTASLEGRGLRRGKLAAHHAWTFRTQASCETTNPVLYRASSLALRMNQALSPCQSR